MEGSDRAALVGTWHPARVNPPQGPKGSLMEGLEVDFSGGKTMQTRPLDASAQKASSLKRNGVERRRWQRGEREILYPVLQA